MNVSSNIFGDCLTTYFQTIKNIDSFRCFIARLTVFASYYDFGYYNLGLLFLIIFLSIFGGIKEMYRWLLLNQAIFDLLYSYSYSCLNFVKPTKCIYVLAPGLSYLSLVNIFIERVIKNNPYSGLFLLTISRLLALYFPNLYTKFTKKIFFIIIFLNFFIFFLSSRQIFEGVAVLQRNVIIAECDSTKLYTKAVCIKKGLDADLVVIFTAIYKALDYISLFIPSLLLLFSVISSNLIILRLLKQAKFQLKHNPKDFQNSLRICFVIFFQNLITSFLFFLVSIEQITYILSNIFKFKVLTTSRGQTWGDATTIVDFRLPLWIDGEWGLAATNPIELLIQIRVFLDSIVVLFVMTGYREALVKLLKLAYFAVRHPKKCWKKVKRGSGVSQTVVLKIRQNSLRT